MYEEERTFRGCIFCKTGNESEVARRFEMSYPGGRAIAPTRSKYRRVRGTVIEERVALLPGYVFFELGNTLADHFQQELPLLSRVDGVLKLLRYPDGSWKLHAYDDQFARMLFDSEGNIGISQAYFDEGRRIRILSGFLKDYEGAIVRVNRKAKTVEVNVDLQGKTVNMKLGYELVAEIDDGA